MSLSASMLITNLFNYPIHLPLLCRQVYIPTNDVNDWRSSSYINNIFTIGHERYCFVETTKIALSK